MGLRLQGFYRPLEMPHVVTSIHLEASVIPESEDVGPGGYFYKKRLIVYLAAGEPYAIEPQQPHAFVAGNGYGNRLLIAPIRRTE